MGKASKRKWQARIARMQKVLAIEKSKDKTPWWQENLFWGPFGILVAIVLAVVAIMKDVRWLLFVAWPCLFISLWVATRDIKSNRTRTVCFIFVIVIAGFGHYSLYIHLDPRAMSNEQLCSQAIGYAQRMRDFDRERMLQEQEIRSSYDGPIDPAKTQEEKSKLYKARTEAFARWFDRRRYDYTNYLMPQAKYLRNQLLLRLPPQPPSEMAPDEAVFLNIGAANISEAADRLEIWAKTLCPQP